jgi:hypothetical protein
LFLRVSGSVVIKNWKPLRLERIADSPLLTVGDILGELTTVATLRIQIYSHPKHHCLCPQISSFRSSRHKRQTAAAAAASVPQPALVIWLSP